MSSGGQEAQRRADALDRVFRPRDQAKLHMVDAEVGEFKQLLDQLLRGVTSKSPLCLINAAHDEPMTPKGDRDSRGPLKRCRISPDLEADRIKRMLQARELFAPSAPDERRIPAAPVPGCRTHQWPAASSDEDWYGTNARTSRDDLGRIEAVVTTTEANAVVAEQPVYELDCLAETLYA